MAPAEQAQMTMRTLCSRTFKNETLTDRTAMQKKEKNA